MAGLWNVSPQNPLRGLSVLVPHCFNKVLRGRLCHSAVYPTECQSQCGLCCSSDRQLIVPIRVDRSVMRKVGMIIRCKITLLKTRRKTFTWLWIPSLLIPVFAPQFVCLYPCYRLIQILWWFHWEISFKQFKGVYWTLFLQQCNWNLPKFWFTILYEHLWSCGLFFVSFWQYVSERLECCLLTFQLHTSEWI